MQGVKLHKEQQAESFSTEKAALVKQLEDFGVQAGLKAAESAKQIDSLAAQDSAQKVSLSRLASILQKITFHSVPHD